MHMLFSVLNKDKYRFCFSTREKTGSELIIFIQYFFKTGKYELIINYLISPPVQYDDKFYHMNIMLADDHIPYENVEIKIHDPNDDIIKIFTHTPMDIEKINSYYILY